LCEDETAKMKSEEVKYPQRVCAHRVGATLAAAAARFFFRFDSLIRQAGQQSADADDSLFRILNL